MINRRCEQCQRTFEVPASVARIGKGRFCSRLCVRTAGADRKKKLPEAKRFWKHVDKRAGLNGCWPWTGCCDRKGYGQFAIGSGKHEGAHRVAYRLEKGVTTNYVLHCCDNPSCCNPLHLRAGTQADNIADAIMRNRLAKGERHGQAKLTTCNIRKIVSAIRSGATQKSQAIAFGVSKGTICDILHGRTWGHLTGL